MACKEFEPGQVAKLSVDITDDTDTLVDPTTLQIRVLKKGSVAPSYDFDYTYPTNSEVVKDAVGQYHFLLTIDDTPGEWKYKWESDAPAQTAKEGSIIVLPTDFD